MLDQNIRPTSDTYSELNRAYDFFNRKLFAGKLPPCLISLQREKNTFGYYSKNRFVRPADGKKTDELAMNPRYFGVRTIQETLSTLVHEMVHIQQAHFGKPGRRGWHNREWGTLMEAIGLMPSSSGKPGGKRTGDKMSHYIIEGGLFEQACNELLTEEFTLSWADRFPPIDAMPLEVKGPGVLGKPDEGEDEEEGPIYPIDPGPEGGQGDDEEMYLPTPTSTGNRVKYKCNICLCSVWGKPGLKILCGTCEGNPFTPQGKKERENLTDDEY